MRNRILVGLTTLFVAAVLQAADAPVAAPPPASGTLEARLGESMGITNFDKVTYADVIDFMRDTTRLPLLIDKRAMKEAGISDKDLVTVHFEKGTRRQCLDAIAKAISKPGHPLVAGVVGNILFITSPARLEKSIKQDLADAAKVNKPELAILNRKLPDLNFKQTRFADAVDFLFDVSGTKIDVNWDHLKPAGVTIDTPIDLRLVDTPFRETLRAVLDQAAAGGKDEDDLDFTVAADGSITVIFVSHAS